MGDETDMIKVLFRLNLSSGWMGGVNYYKNLFLALSKTENPKIIPCLDSSGDSSGSFADITEKADVKLYKTWKYFAGLILNRFFHKNYNLDELIERKYASYKVSSHCNKVKGTVNIQWIPDFQHLYLPEMFSKEEIEYRNKNFKRMAKLSDIVILSSYDALKDYKAFMPEYADKARVLHFVSYFDKHLYKETDLIMSSVFKKYSIPKRYFYIPNQFWKHKNHKIVIEALSILRKKGYRDIHVVCSGNTSDWRNPEYFDGLIDFINKEGLSKNIHILGMIEYKEVICLLRYSIALLQPSLFEGWSSIVEEAKSIGKNCILSNLNVHLEQNPPDSIYFDPHNADQLAEILERTNDQYTSSPNEKLEKTAQELIESRITQFGNEYKKIIQELL